MAKLPKIFLPFTAGLDTGKDPLAEPGKSMAELRNVRFDRTGAAKKRPGYRPTHAGMLDADPVLISSSTVVTGTGSVRRLDTNEEVDTMALSSVQTWPMTQTHTDIPETQVDAEEGRYTGLKRYASCMVGDIIVVAWYASYGTYATPSFEGGRLYVQSFDKQGRPLSTPSLLSNAAFHVTAVTVGDSAHVYWKDSSDDVNLSVVPAVDPSAYTTAVVVNDLDADDDPTSLGEFDACSGYLAGVPYSWLVYRYDASLQDDELRVKRVQEDGTVDATSGNIENASGDDIRTLSCAYSPERGEVAIAKWATNQILRVGTVDASALTAGTFASQSNGTATNPGTLQYGCCWDGDSIVAMMNAESTGGDANGVLTYRMNADTGVFTQANVPTPDTQPLNTFPASRPWVDDQGKIWCWLKEIIQDQSSIVSRGTGYYLWREDYGIAAVLFPLRAGATWIRSGYTTDATLSNQQAIMGDGYFVFPVEDTEKSTALHLARVRINDDSRPVVAPDGENVAAGLNWVITGAGVSEASPVHFPSFSLATAQSGGAFTAGTYEFTTQYKHRLPNGKLMYSGLSEIDVVSVSSNQQVKCFIPRPAYSKLYATKQVTGILNVAPNDTGLATVMAERYGTDEIDYLEVTTDRHVATHPAEFYRKREVQASNPGPLLFITALGYRLWAVGGDGRVYYSKIAEEGIQPAFSDEQYLSFTEFGGRPVAVGAVGDTAIILKESAVYAVAGDGPDNLGRGAFSEPRLVSPAIGCAEPRSVVQTPVGLMWLSDRGFYALANNFVVNYIGDAVEAFNDKTVTASWCVAGKNEVRWLTSDGVQLVFDYENGIWSTDDIGGNCALVANGTYYLGRGRKVLVETEGVYDDDGDFYPSVAEYNWIKLDRLASEVAWNNLEFQGFAEQAGDISVRVTVWYDFDKNGRFDQWDQTWEDCVVGQSLTFTKRLSKQKARAVKIRIEETNPTGAGLSFSGCALAYRQRPGRGKFPAKYKPRSK